MKTKQQCSKRMMVGYTSTTCRAEAKVERDGKWYCKRHDPARVKALDDARQAKYDADFEAAKIARAAKAKADAHAALCVSFHERLLEALKHDHWRNHEFSEGCTACTKSRALLAEIQKESE